MVKASINSRLSDIDERIHGNEHNIRRLLHSQKQVACKHNRLQVIIEGKGGWIKSATCEDCGYLVFDDYSLDRACSVKYIHRYLLKKSK